MSVPWTPVRLWVLKNQDTGGKLICSPQSAVLSLRFSLPHTHVYTQTYSTTISPASPATLSLTHFVSSLILQLHKDRAALLPSELMGLDRERERECSTDCSEVIKRDLPHLSQFSAPLTQACQVQVPASTFWHTVFYLSFLYLLLCLSLPYLSFSLLSLFFHFHSHLPTMPCLSVWVPLWFLDIFFYTVLLYNLLKAIDFYKAIKTEQVSVSPWPTAASTAVIWTNRQ